MRDFIEKKRGKTRRITRNWYPCFVFICFSENTLNLLPPQDKKSSSLCRSLLCTSSLAMRVNAFCPSCFFLSFCSSELVLFYFLLVSWSIIFSLLSPSFSLILLQWIIERWSPFFFNTKSIALGFLRLLRSTASQVDDTKRNTWDGSYISSALDQSSISV